MNVARAWLASLASLAAGSTAGERQWYRRRQLKVARAIVLGATLKKAGAAEDIGPERARQILNLVQRAALKLPECPAEPPVVDRWNTASMREHAKWWCARFDELAHAWGVADEASAVVSTRSRSDGESPTMEQVNNEQAR